MSRRSFFRRKPARDAIGPGDARFDLGVSAAAWFNNQAGRLGRSLNAWQSRATPGQVRLWIGGVLLLTFGSFVWTALHGVFDLMATLDRPAVRGISRPIVFDSRVYRRARSGLARSGTADRVRQRDSLARHGTAASQTTK